MNRYDVREKARYLPNFSGLIALLPATVAIMSIASLLLVVQTSRVATAGYDINRLAQIRDEWRDRNFQLEADVAYLQSLERVEKEATTRFNMKPATNYLYVTVPVSLNPKPVSAVQSLNNKSELAEEGRRKWWDALLHPLAFFNESRFTAKEG
ncbi:MAG: hypothetical protein ABIH46_03310 [Chloroflexota bacterium]